VQTSALYKIAVKGIMREIRSIKSLFIVLFSFGLVITLILINIGLSYQETKAQSEKIRIIAVDDAFSDLSRNLTTTTGTDNGTG
jgi:ABC-type Na+ efflux pump permease subunit